MFETRRLLLSKGKKYRRIIIDDSNEIKLEQYDGETISLYCDNMSVDEMSVGEEEEEEDDEEDKDDKEDEDDEDEDDEEEDDEEEEEEDDDDDDDDDEIEEKDD